MADWKNRMDQITNKVKTQLNARGVDNMDQLKDVFFVSIVVLLAPVRGSLRLVCRPHFVAVVDLILNRLKNTNIFSSLPSIIGLR